MISSLNIKYLSLLLAPCDRKPWILLRMEHSTTALHAERIYFLLAPTSSFWGCWSMFWRRLSNKFCFLRTWLIPLLGRCKVLLSFAVDLLDLAPDLQLLEGHHLAKMLPGPIAVSIYTIYHRFIDGNAAIKSTWRRQKRNTNTYQTLVIKHILIVCKKNPYKPQKNAVDGENHFWSFSPSSPCQLVGSHEGLKRSSPSCTDGR